MSVDPYTSRHRPQPVNSNRPYRPREFNKVSRVRFERNRWGELLRHFARPPTYPEKLIINRIIAIEWELLRTDAKLDRGEELSGHDIRGRLAAENRLRLDLVALGLDPPKAQPTDPLEAIRRHTARRSGPNGGAA